MGHLRAERPLGILAIDFTLLEPSSNGTENVLVMTDAFQSLPKQYQQKIRQRRPWHEYWLSVGFICLGC